MLAQLDHRRATLPELAKIEALEGEARDLDGRRVEAETEVGDLERAQAKFDLEVEQVRQRRIRDEERLSSGAITNPKDLAGLQHELGALDRRISTLEDEELEIMERLEEAQGQLASVTQDLERVRVDLDHETTARNAAFEAIDTQSGSVRGERDDLAAQIPDALLALYDKMRSLHGGLGAAALVSRRCEGCRLELNGADLRELAAKPDDEVLRCPECSRILVRTAESGV